MTDVIERKLLFGDKLKNNVFVSQCPRHTLVSPYNVNFGSANFYTAFNSQQSGYFHLLSHIQSSDASDKFEFDAAKYGLTYEVATIINMLPTDIDKIIWCYDKCAIHPLCFLFASRLSSFSILKTIYGRLHPRADISPARVDDYEHVMINFLNVNKGIIEWVKDNILFGTIFQTQQLMSLYFFFAIHTHQNVADNYSAIAYYTELMCSKLINIVSATNNMVYSFVRSLAAVGEFDIRIIKNESFMDIVYSYAEMESIRISKHMFMPTLITDADNDENFVFATDNNTVTVINVLHNSITAVTKKNEMYPLYTHNTVVFSDFLIQLPDSNIILCMYFNFFFQKSKIRVNNNNDIIIDKVLIDGNNGSQIINMPVIRDTPVSLSIYIGSDRIGSLNIDKSYPLKKLNTLYMGILPAPTKVYPFNYVLAPTRSVFEYPNYMSYVANYFVENMAMSWNASQSYTSNAMTINTIVFGQNFNSVITKSPICMIHNLPPFPKRYYLTSLYFNTIPFDKMSPENVIKSVMCRLLNVDSALRSPITYMDELLYGGTDLVSTLNNATKNFVALLSSSTISKNHLDYFLMGILFRLFKVVVTNTTATDYIANITKYYTDFTFIAPLLSINISNTPQWAIAQGQIPFVDIIFSVRTITLCRQSSVKNKKFTIEMIGSKPTSSYSYYLKTEESVLHVYFFLRFEKFEKNTQITVNCYDNDSTMLFYLTTIIT